MHVISGVTDIDFVHHFAIKRIQNTHENKNICIWTDKMCDINNERDTIALLLILVPASNFHKSSMDVFQILPISLLAN